MAVVQDVYNDAPAKGFAGQISNGETSNRISRTVAPGDVAGIAFGAFAFDPAVAAADTDHMCTATPTVNKCLGPVIANHGLAIFTSVVAGAVGADIQGPRSTAGVCTQGRILVVSTTACAKGDTVYVTPAGAITNASAGNIAATQANGQTWKFDETMATAGLVNVARR